MEGEEELHGALGRSAYCFWYVHYFRLQNRVLMRLSALQFPYVLAFEPSFVEIRHVETGQLVQIIKGHNLRCLFADTPPSAINYSQASYQRASQFNGPPGFAPPAFMYKPPYVRDEILLVSDDRIMMLRSLAFIQPQNQDQNLSPRSSIATRR